MKESKSLTAIQSSTLSLAPGSGRGVARGGGAEPPWNLADQLNLSKARGVDYAPHFTDSPPGFKKLSTPLSGKEQQSTNYKLL